MTRFRQLTLASLAALLAAGSIRCSGGSNTQPQTPSAIEMAAGDGQVAGVGAALPSPLAVLVTDQSGNPVQGVDVGWDAQGGGSVSAASVQTGADGKASVTRVLGPTAGDQTTTASVGGLQGSPVTFTATATDGTTPMLAMKTQPSSGAQSGVAFAVQPVVQLKDASGSDNPQSGVAVTASLASGTGTLGGTLTRSTDGTGAATFTDLQITGAVGSYTLRFSTAGTTPVVSSTITIGAGAASIVITTNPPTSALTGEVFDPAAQPVVQVKDASGAAAPGVQVTATVVSGGGTLQGTATATSDASGFARFGDLGISGTGAQTLQFTTGSSSVTASPVNLSPLLAAATTGQWGPVVNWDIVPLHMHLLPTGKVLAWASTRMAASWARWGACRGCGIPPSAPRPPRRRSRPTPCSSAPGTPRWRTAA